MKKIAYLLLISWLVLSCRNKKDLYIPYIVDSEGIDTISYTFEYDNGRRVSCLLKHFGGASSLIYEGLYRKEGKTRGAFHEDPLFTDSTGKIYTSAGWDIFLKYDINLDVGDTVQYNYVHAQRIVDSIYLFAGRKCLVFKYTLPTSTNMNIKIITYEHFLENVGTIKIKKDFPTNKDKIRLVLINRTPIEEFLQKNPSFTFFPNVFPPIKFSPTHGKYSPINFPPDK